MLPFLGPSNVRDTVGLVGDTAISSFVGPDAWVDDEARDFWSFSGVISRGQAAPDSLPLPADRFAF